MFCVECGAEGPTYDGLCARCFAKKHPLVEPPTHLDLPRCRVCGSFHLRTGWERMELDLAIPRLLAETVPPLPPFQRVLFTADARPEDESNLHLTVKASGRHEDLRQVQDFHARLRIKPSLCDVCQKQASRYYEGILQVRGDGRDLTPAELRAVRTLVLSRVERGREEGGDFLAKIEEVHGGLDFYLSTNPLGARLARQVAEAFGGSVTSSPKLYGRQEGKELYRVTTLVRLPAFQVGAVVRHKGGLAEVLSLAPFVELRDLRTGDARRYKTKDLRGLRRVDAERFEAEVRRDPDGHAVVAHPESGEERRIEVHGPERARAVVVWTADGAFLSGLRVPGSKD